MTDEPTIEATLEKLRDARAMLAALYARDIDKHILLNALIDLVNCTQKVEQAR